MCTKKSIKVLAAIAASALCLAAVSCSQPADESSNSAAADSVTLDASDVFESTSTFTASAVIYNGADDAVVKTVNFSASSKTADVPVSILASTTNPYAVITVTGSDGELLYRRKTALSSSYSSGDSVSIIPEDPVLLTSATYKKSSKKSSEYSTNDCICYTTDRTY